MRQHSISPKAAPLISSCPSIPRRVANSDSWGMGGAISLLHIITLCAITLLKVFQLGRFLCPFFFRFYIKNLIFLKTYGTIILRHNRILHFRKVCFLLGKNAYSSLAYLYENACSVKGCVAAIGAMRFSVRSFRLRTFLLLLFRRKAYEKDGL